MTSLWLQSAFILCSLGLTIGPLIAILHREGRQETPAELFAAHVRADVAALPTVSATGSYDEGAAESFSRNGDGEVRFLRLAAQILADLDAFASACDRPGGVDIAEQKNSNGNAVAERLADVQRAARAPDPFREGTEPLRSPWSP